MSKYDCEIRVGARVRVTSYYSRGQGKGTIVMVHMGTNLSGSPVALVKLDDGKAIYSSVADVRIVPPSESTQ